MSNNSLEKLSELTTYLLFVVTLLTLVVVIQNQSQPVRVIQPVIMSATPAPSVYANPGTSLSASSAEHQLYVQQILNRPENLYRPVDQPTPAQAILEGRSTKFLVGM